MLCILSKVYFKNKQNWNNISRCFYIGDVRVALWLLNFRQSYEMCQSLCLELEQEQQQEKENKYIA